MAVVQISKIQLRRGRKNSGSGMPQLASGELAWAIDTQELFIGNGAVGEGAPYVGNTKVLTEHDNILDLLATYQYKYDSNIQQSLISGVKKRSLQSRLDDGAVNARNFDIKSVSELLIGEEDDQTAKIQLAVNELASDVPVDLVFDPGVFRISDTITLPSNVSIVGFGKDVTVFEYTNPTLSIIFETEEDSTNIRLKNFTIKSKTNQKVFIKINNSKNCNFEKLKLVFDDGTAVTNPVFNDNLVGFKLIGYGDILANTFKEIEFRRLTYGIYGDSRTSFNTIDNCLFEYLYQGINLGFGTTGLGACYNKILNSTFDKITRQSLVVENGTGNVSKNNIHKDVGSQNSGIYSLYSVVKFVTDGNVSEDIFERRELLELDNTASSYISEIEGIVSNQSKQPRQLSLPYSASFIKAFNLPLNFGTSFKVDYVFRSTTVNHSQVRKGTLNIAADRINERVQLIDEYEFIGDDSNDENSLIFTASIINVSGGSKIIEVRYKNLVVGDTNTFTYSYTTLSY